MAQHQGTSFHYKLFTYPNPKPQQESGQQNSLLVLDQEYDLKESNSILSDDQSLYVLFQPLSTAGSVTNTQQSAHESDILSLTTSNNTPRGTSEAAADAVAGATVALVGGEESEFSRHTITTTQDTLSSKIENWNESSYQQDEIVDDNIASWDLDEGLSTPKYFDRAFYGDDLFKHMSKVDFSKFIKIHQQNKLALNPKMDQMMWKYLQDSRSPQPYMSLKTMDYLSTFKTLETSDTNTTNSLLLCGGSNQWSDHMG
ncbi:uncharacterized protein KQ657_003678 [Scheffersomyces spartinae]|uniref:Uncharacterized protein n=1 Tax=Scheffersomyces spartinae TaxID=45513 RepID=A0A9P7VCU3_9ASCO|nr:uncharacterized protein KQ657_003678 [Scheffersomyces spartinae]KAG7195156.1 hypothetical protein KQ657_003678 [Scheffersomyces spartinae]